MNKIKAAALQPLMIDNDYKANIENTIRLLEKAGSEGCDIVTTCEDVSNISILSIDVTEGNRFPELVRQSQPLVETALGAIAKKYSMYIVGAYIAERDGNYYNVASVFDRKGAIIGEYRKTHLPANETFQIKPGNDLNVFKLDFGTVGIAICYDMMFPEAVRTLALKGAQIIFHPTYGYGWYDEIGEATLKTRANDNGVYIVTSKNCTGGRSAGKSSIIDHWGYVLDDALYKENAIAVAEIDLDVPKTQGDWYINGAITGMAIVTERMRAERRPELYTALCDTSIKRVPVRSREEQLELYRRYKAEEIRWNEFYPHQLIKLVM